MRHASPRVVALFVWAGLCGVPGVQAATMLPPNFVVENAVPGVTFDLPTCVAFLPGGRMLVGEKKGVVWLVENGIRRPDPLWSREDEVATGGDWGLMSIAVDPQFALNRRVYFLYVADPDSNGVDDDPNAFGRLARYEFSSIDSTELDPQTRRILLGRDWSHGPLTAAGGHTVGALRWGADGSLLISIGDGSVSSSVDAGGLYPAAFGPGLTDTLEDVGAFRARDFRSFTGKILRMNPNSGAGYSSNPFYRKSESSLPRSLVWAYGMRNPFRMCVRPGTGSPSSMAGDPGALLIGDVGWLSWEEINLSNAPGLNFGWPCFEGAGMQHGYQLATPSHSGCKPLIEATNPSPPTAPLFSWHHTDSSAATPPGTGLLGNCAIAGVFYTGTRYPLPFQGAFFFADFGGQWLRTATFDSTQTVTGVSAFGADLQGPVDFATDPVDGDIHYVAIASGQVRRIRYSGPEGFDPFAQATADRLVGVAPLTVNFSGSTSFSPIGRPITHQWLFGDGQGASGAEVSHAYAEPGEYDVLLAVLDDQGGECRDTLRVVVTGSASFPTTTVLDDFNRADGPLGAPWVDDLFGLVVADSQLTQEAGQATPVWDGGEFGPNQEAYVTLNAISPSPHHTLMLKVQGANFLGGHVQVRYDATGSRVSVATFAPGMGWVDRGSIEKLIWSPGDRFGARMYSNGVVEVYRNGGVIGTLLALDWPFAAAGGRIGFVLQDGSSSLLDDFGGGTADLGLNQPPVAQILSPLDSTFFAAGDTVRLIGAATDPNHPPDSLAYHWQVDQRHNNHVHPGVFLSDEIEDFLVGEDHDDGTGSHLVVNLWVTDPRGARDTARVAIFPEVDLEPGSLTTDPALPPSTGESEYRFWIRNHGRMPAPISHWVLRVAGLVVAEGDLAVPALDSAQVAVLAEPVVGPGTYEARVDVDTAPKVVETDEANNRWTGTLQIVTGIGPDEHPPWFLNPPVATAYGVTASIEWATNEPAGGTLRFGPTPALEDSLMVPADTTAPRVVLQSLQPSSLYYFQVRTVDTVGNFRDAPLDSFVTNLGPLAVDGTGIHEVGLSQARPNPSRGGVNFVAELPRRARVRATVYDIQGRQVWAGIEAEFEPGRHALKWSGEGLGWARVRPGLYLARFELGEQVFLRRIVIVS